MEKNILLYAEVKNDKLLLATKEDFENLNNHSMVDIHIISTNGLIEYFVRVKDIKCSNREISCKVDHGIVYNIYNQTVEYLLNYKKLTLFGKDLSDCNITVYEKLPLKLLSKVRDLISKRVSETEKILSKLKVAESVAYFF